jgi:uncharacterized integral membrane protein
MATDDQDRVPVSEQRPETPAVDAPETATAQPGRPVPDPPRGRALIAQWSFVSTVVALLLAAIFVLQNTRTVDIEFLFWIVNVPLAAALLLSLAAGGLIASLIMLLRQHQYRRALTRERDAG